VEGQRPLQLIIPSLDNMFDVVRTYDLSHLRIWYNRDGLYAQLDTIYELCRGFTHLIRAGINTFDRIDKYTKKGWTILGNNNFLQMEKYEKLNVEYEIIDPDIAYNFFVDKETPLLGYVQNQGMHIGNIRNLIQTDFKSFKIEYNVRHFITLFTPIIFWMDVEKITFVRYLQDNNIKAEIILDTDIKYIINELLKYLVPDNQKIYWNDYSWYDKSGHFNLVLNSEHSSKLKFDDNNKLILNNVSLKICLSKMGSSTGVLFGPIENLLFDRIHNLLIDFIQN
jgi:hypothetical protein